MTTSKKPVLISTFATLLSLAVLALPGTASAASAAGDFSTASNPNGDWSYGWTSTLGSAFNLNPSNTTSYAGLGLSGWLGDLRPADGIPYVLYNPTPSPITLALTTYQPGQLAEQPGPNNEFSVVRWIAPFSGSFSIAATFSGLDSFGDSADVHILHDGISIFNSTVTGSPSPTSYSGLQNIVAGDTIDFVVGNGGNGQNDDTTALSATIVPEPGTLGLVGMGFGCLLSFRLRKRTQKNCRPVISTTEHTISASSARKGALVVTVATLLCLAALALPGTASAASAAGDFSTASNPNGAWSYGSSANLGSAFIPSAIPTNNYAGLSLDGWLGTSDSSGTPYALRNATSHNITNANTIYQPGQLGLQPGAQGQYEVVRWTAVSSGTFGISATFSGLASVGDSVDVHILLDGVSIFNSTVNGSPSPTSYSGLQNVLAGDTVDFAVGYGNGNNFSDTTGLSATIVPEPTTLGLVAMSLAGLLSFRSLKRK